MSVEVLDSMLFGIGVWGKRSSRPWSGAIRQMPLMREDQVGPIQCVSSQLLQTTEKPAVKTHTACPNTAQQQRLSIPRR